jgi:hypothetical protein
MPRLAMAVGGVVERVGGPCLVWSCGVLCAFQRPVWQARVGVRQVRVCVWQARLCVWQARG